MTDTGFEAAALALLGPRAAGAATAAGDPADVGALQAVAVAVGPVTATVYRFAGYDEAMAVWVERSRTGADGDGAVTSVNGDTLAVVTWPPGDDEAADTARSLVSDFAGEE